MNIEGQEAIKRSLSNAFTEKRRLAKKYKQEGEGLQRSPTLVLDSTHRRAFLSGFLQNWRSGLSRPCLRNSEAQFDAIGQWAENLTSKK